MAKKQTLRTKPLGWLDATVFGTGLAVVLLAGSEIFAIGWGSGSFLGRLSLKWTLTLGVLYLLGAFLLLELFFALYKPARWVSQVRRLVRWRETLSSWRLTLAVLVVLLPAWFVFYSAWGALFHGLFLRLVVFVLCSLASGFLLTHSKSTLLEWKPLLLGGLLLGGVLVLAESFVLVSDYPFALHWSEGNRLWDYSVLFGADRFNYPPQEGGIFAWIDSIRQTLWGLPFLIPDASIIVVRLWNAILVTLPYALLGLLVFRRREGGHDEWLLAGLWSMIFLNQGPIYTPLVLAAILVALARRKPIWLAIPLLFFAGDYAGTSRYSWRFAPAIWAVMLTFGDAVWLYGYVRSRDWLQAAALALAGVWTKGLPLLGGVVVGLLQIGAKSGDPTAQPTTIAQGGVENLEGLINVSTQQPFLWERLLPNSIYPPGIVIALALATLPLITLLVYLAKKKYWKTELWQLIATVGGLGSVLVVGVIASAKVGGGTDLHNMDMFLIGLVLVAALAWEGFAPNIKKLLAKMEVRWLLVALIFIPSFMPMVKGKPLELPSAERTQFVLGRIQAFAGCARQYGEVLFMDQRQLLTFGNVGDVPLVVEYEKKYVMDQALKGDQEYFQKFREDLASGRFSLIVTEREAILYKDDETETIGDSLNEENNAWVTWVTTPLLDHYESVADYKDAAIELFMPIGRNFDCP